MVAGVNGVGDRIGFRRIMWSLLLLGVRMSRQISGCCAWGATIPFTGAEDRSGSTFGVEAIP